MEEIEVIEVIKQVDDRGVDTSIKVYRDESLKRRYSVEPKSDQEEFDRQEALSQNKLQNMGFESSLQKDERVFRFKSLVEQGKIVTVQSAVNELKVARSTILGYVKETGVEVFDEQKQVWLNAKQ